MPKVILLCQGGVMGELKMVKDFIYAGTAGYDGTDSPLHYQDKQVGHAVAVLG